MKKACIILGTRPEIIKFSSIIREFIKKRFHFFILHTNQHYSEKLDKIFFKELELPQPKYNLKIGSGTHAESTAKMLIGIEKVLFREKPDIVLVLGDTNTTLAGALAAVKIHIKIGHIEAGPRSYSKEMPEEINRIIVDHISDYLFTSVKREKDILIKEGIPKGKIFIAGNPIVDAVYQNLKIAEKKSKIFKKLHLEKEKYFLVTAHRQENVDKKEKLQGILEGLKLIHQEFELPIIYPIHPRTQKRLKDFKLLVPEEIKLIPPLGYLAFLDLESNALLTLTDSGGVQEESCILNVPCVSFRENTEWPETLENGSNTLAGVNPRKILNGAKKLLDEKKNWKNPFGNGKSGKTIMDIVGKII
ncbi:UDP-N-acetylglucosamine 2-epimerase (non-hydrolyzing) [Candidatus Parcubacteria bacterium]|nr:UDP-N-acetylglucosamine 2-epimerase (non-hydrolyzing) [Candidatus Parcubacteria bacterium]